MKIKCTTDRKPWADGEPLLNGETRDVSDEDAKALISLGFAEKAAGRPAKKSDD